MLASFLYPLAQAALACVPRAAGVGPGRSGPATVRLLAGDWAGNGSGSRARRYASPSRSSRGRRRLRDDARKGASPEPAQIELGCVELRLGTVDNLPFDDDTFDAGMAINCIHLWPDPVRGLKELARTLRPGGRVAVAISRFSYASPDKFEKQLGNAGFSDVSIQQGPRGTCALGRVKT
jgi:SAM-dependent methyltransferase